MNENTTIENVVTEAIETIPVQQIKDKPSLWAIVLLILAAIGAGSSVWIVYKGVRFILTKFKDGSWTLQKAPQQPQQVETAQAAPKAEEQPVEK